MYIYKLFSIHEIIILVKKFLFLIKGFAFILVWYLQVQSSEKTEWYIEFYSDKNTIHTIGRDHYLEAIELLDGNEDEKYIKQYHNLLYNESLGYTKLPANTEIGGYIHDYKINEKPKTLPLYKINH